MWYILRSTLQQMLYFISYLYELYSFGRDRDEPLAIEVADGAFEHFLAHLEAALDVFSVAFVAEVALPSVVLEVFEESL